MAKHKVVINRDYGGFGLSDLAKRWIMEKYVKTGKVDKETAFECRHGEALVSCVETLGTRANDSFADLVVVEIDSDRYRIDEYDGLETVYTPDDEVWIEIE